MGLTIYIERAKYYKAKDVVVKGRPVVPLHGGDVKIVESAVTFNGHWWLHSMLGSNFINAGENFLELESIQEAVVGIEAMLDVINMAPSKKGKGRGKGKKDFSMPRLLEVAEYHDFNRQDIEQLKDPQTTLTLVLAKLKLLIAADDNYEYSYYATL